MVSYKNVVSFSLKITTKYNLSGPNLQNFPVGMPLDRACFAHQLFLQVVTFLSHIYVNVCKHPPPPILDLLLCYQCDQCGQELGFFRAIGNSGNGNWKGKMEMENGNGQNLNAM